MEDRMNCKRVWVCAMLMLACAALVFAQDQANEIRCSGSGTTCKTNFFPKCASNGGTDTVSDSIVSQSGTTIIVAGSETVHGTINAGQGINSIVGPQIAVIGQTNTGGVGVFGANGSATAGFGVQRVAVGIHVICAALSTRLLV